MTDNDFNLTAEELETEHQIKEVLSKTTYTLDSKQYDELTRTASLYESLNVILESFDSDNSPLTHVVDLLDHLNSSFFEFIETIESDSSIS